MYLVTGNGTTNTLRTYDAKTGAALGSLTAPGTGQPLYSPVVSNGRAYLLSSGVITAFAPAAT